MGKVVPDATHDASLNEVATATAVRVTSSEPANRAAAVTATLATTSLAGGDFTNADGDTDGRKVTIAAKSGVSVTATGTGNHFSYDDGTDLTLVTTCGSQSLTSGNTVDIGSITYTIRDPS